MNKLPLDVIAYCICNKLNYADYFNLIMSFDQPKNVKLVDGHVGSNIFTP